MFNYLKSFSFQLRPDLKHSAVTQQSRAERSGRRTSSKRHCRLYGAARDPETFFSSTTQKRGLFSSAGSSGAPAWINGLQGAEFALKGYYCPGREPKHHRRLGALKGCGVFSCVHSDKGGVLLDLRGN
ncbi:hypothetical protein MHYP_G00090950 [Metynnis hypsauchen]